MVLPVTYKQNKQKLSNLFCVSVVAVKTLPVSVASVSLILFHLHNLGLHLSSQPHLPHLPPLPPHCHHFPHCPALHPAHPALHHQPWHLPQTVHHHQCHHCCHYCWLVRGSLFIELGCTRDLGKGWRGDLGTFMISRSI